MTTEQVNLFFEIINRNFKDYKKVKILEAGCGSYTRIKPTKIYTVSGIDISEKQLERNEHLSEKICGDIQTYPLSRLTYDMIICWCVLEHLKYPEKALMNFLNTLKPNGVFVLVLPNIWSVKGIFTKFTPTFVHVWFYRYFLREKSAGKEDIGPFKTYFKKEISLKNLRRYAQKHNMEEIYFTYIINEIKVRKPIKQVFTFFMTFTGILLWVLSFGKIRQRNAEFMIVLRKVN